MSLTNLGSGSSKPNSEQRKTIFDKSEHLAHLAKILEKSYNPSGEVFKS